MRISSVRTQSIGNQSFELILWTLHADKTTDENLTSENWELILNLCDKVQEEGQPGYASSNSGNSLN